MDILTLDVRGLSSITDAIMLCSGNSAPHLKALAAATAKHMKDHGVKAYRKSGEAESGWVVLDFVDVIIHILSKECRDYYAIEALWESAPRLD